MSKISKLFLLLLAIENALSIQAGLNEEENPLPIEIEFGSKVEYDKNRNYFKFDYQGINNTLVHFVTTDSKVVLSMTYPKGNKKELSDYSWERGYEANITENGTYLLKVTCISYNCELGGSFIPYIIGDVMGSIDFSKKIYYKKGNFYSTGYYYGMYEYKVGELNEEKYVFFSSPIDYFYRNYYIYYPEDDNPPVDPYYDRLIHYPNESIFEVFNVKDNETQKNVKLYKFEKNKEYIIKIHCLKYYYTYSYDSSQFYYPEYIFFPVTYQNFIQITGEAKFFSFDGPMLGLVNPNIDKNFTIVAGNAFYYYNYFIYAKTNETLDYNLDNLSTKIQNLEFTKINRLQFDIIENDNLSTLISFLPEDYESKTNIIVTDAIETECKDTYIIPANKEQLIFCKENLAFEMYNNITTFTSQEKTIHVLFSEVPEGTDYLIKNLLNHIIYVEKSDKEQIITMKNYSPRFVFFGAENPYLFNTFYSFVNQMPKTLSDGINFNNYQKITQMNLRINTKYLPWYEFYNFYINKMKVPLNAYIKQIYGGSEAYECDGEGFNERDLTFLTTPISNMKCKNKRSLLNRLFYFDGTSKVLSGYLGPDSYFDMYVEVAHEEENTLINISSIMTDTIHTTNAAKYLKKNIEYTLNFYANHIVKLEPGFNAEITITKGKTTSKINPEYPIVEISGRGYTILSNSDAMVYFIGRFYEKEFVQREIDIERSKGKIVKISNVEKDIEVDIGFKGYYPSTILVEMYIRSNGVVYLSNIYDKLKEKLAPKEKVFIYHGVDVNKNMQIEYFGKNLENKYTDYNIFLIPANNEINSLVINTYNSHRDNTTLITDFQFCEKDAKLKISYIFDNTREINVVLTNENYTLFNNLNLHYGDNLISFSTDKPLVFSYSLTDFVDYRFFGKNDTFLQERQHLIILRINEITFKKDNDKIIEVKFRPNYKLSSTRYIIIIAQKNQQNTLKTFSNPCYITGLLNQRPSGVKVDTIYDVGENDLINAEVDISEIISNNDQYLINIISQELRFEKKVNFYEPLEFSHNGIIPYDDSESDSDSDSDVKTDDSNTNNSDNISDNNKEKQEEEGSSSDSTTLALAITIPIIGLLVIAVVVLFILRRKGNTSDSIEKLTGI